MSHSGIDPESYIAESTAVCEDKCEPASQAPYPPGGQVGASPHLRPVPRGHERVFLSHDQHDRTHDLTQSMLFAWRYRQRT